MVESENLQANVEKHSRKNIKIGAILGYVSLILAVVSGLVYTPWIVREIGNSSYGLYSLSLSIVNLFLLDFGLSATTNTFLARYRANHDEEGARNFLGAVYRLYFIIDAILLAIFVVVFFLIPFIYVGLTVEEIEKLKVVFAISAAFSLASFPCSTFNGIIAAYEEYIWQNVINIVQKLLFIGLSAAALLGHLDLYGLVAANCGSALIAIGLKYIIIRKTVPVRANLRFRPPKEFLKEVLLFSMWAAIASITARLVFNVMPSILGIVSDSNNIAVFGIVASLESYIYLFSNVIGSLYLPKIARLIEEGAPQETIDELAIRIGKIQLFILGLIVVGFACCGQEFLMIWMHGDELYLTAYPGLLMIIASQLVFIPQTVFHNQMYVVGHVKHVALVSIGKAVLNLGLSFVLGYFFGAFGACLSIGISRVIEVFLYNVFYRRDIHAGLRRFFLKTYVPFIATFVVSLALGLILHFFLPFSRLYNFLIIGSAVAVSYVLLSWFVSLSKEERHMVVGGLFRRRAIEKQEEQS